MFFFLFDMYIFLINFIYNNCIALCHDSFLTEVTLNSKYDDSFFYIKPDNHSYYNHNFFDLPWPASEKMTSLVILYLEVSYTILFVFLVVSFVLIETIIVYSSNELEKNIYNLESEEVSLFYP